MLQTNLKRPSSTHRVVQRLKWADLAKEGPGFKKQRLKGSRAKGMTYERKIGRILRDWLREVQEPELAEGKLFLGQWICFRDKNGRGFAQPDAFIVFPWGIWLFECKLTQSDGAEAQAMKLYKPLLEFIYGKPVVACQIFKNMRYRVEKMIEQPEDLIKQKGYWQWHNLG